MNIQEIREKFKGFLTDTEYLLTGLIVVVSVCSFFLGRLSVSENAVYSPSVPTTIQNSAQVKMFEEGVVHATSSSESPVSGQYVASKSGTKYHLPWCPGAKQIKEENKVFFATKEEAEAAGYTPASNCKGI